MQTFRSTSIYVLFTSKYEILFLKHAFGDLVSVI